MPLLVNSQSAALPQPTILSSGMMNWLTQSAAYRGIHSQRMNHQPVAPRTKPTELWNTRVCHT